MADIFAASGYATGHIGKWHLGDSYPFRPQDRGFQHTLHHGAWGITSLADYWGNTYFDPVLNLNGENKKYEGFCTDIFFNESMEWIDQQQADGKPFFLYLATNTPSTQLWTGSFDASFDTRVFQGIATYGGDEIIRNGSAGDFHPYYCCKPTGSP